MGRVARRWAARGLGPCLVALALVVLAACSEKDRKAFVSILPLTGHDSTSAEGAAEAPTGFGLTADSTAVVLNGDTILTVERLPTRGPGGTELAARAFREVALSPDSSAVAFVTRGAVPAAGVWSRADQVASVGTALVGGAVDSLEWAPGGRFLSWSARDSAGVAKVGVYDTRLGRATIGPGPAWLARHGRSVRPESWLDDHRLRVLVSPGAAPTGGWSHLWDIERGDFVLESHVEAVARDVPAGGSLVRGGVVSLDLVDGPAPETVALFVAGDGSPGAVLLEDRGAGVRSVVTDPLLPPGALGYEKWKQAQRSPVLYQLAELGGRPTLLVALAPPDRGYDAIALFQPTRGGRLEPVRVDTGQETGPAVFFDGSTPAGTTQFGLLDLDGDGSLEAVSAVGEPSNDPIGPRIRWRTAAYRWRGKGLVRAPELDDAVARAVQRLTTGRE